MAAVPVLVTLVLFFARTHLMPVLGDQPHYLIMADSVAGDFDLDLRNNYERDFERPVILGKAAPHAVDVGGRWMPFHAPGLSILLALPFVLGGGLACRITLCVLAGLLPYTLFRWFSRAMTRQSAAWLAIATVLSVPVLFGASQIFPDLLTGIVATMLVVWLANRADDERPIGATTTWGGYWLVSGLLPWLNYKFAPTTVVLALGGAWVARRASRRGGSPGPWTTCPLIAIGPVALLVFNYRAYGSLIGPRGAPELTTSGFRALLIFLGLHFDQSQGMFAQQPLLLVGVAALVPFIRARPRLAVFWLMAYLSLIVPNSFELSRFGMMGPDGRFGWSAEWLWMIPIGFLAGSARTRFERWVRPLAAAALAYQAALAVRWVAAPMELYPVLEEQLSRRDSLFPVWMRAVVPSYYLWDFRSYLTYPPNVVAVIGMVAVMAAGAILLRPAERPAAQL
jgi:hypothetical protein